MSAWTASNAVVIGDYGKGIITQDYLDELKELGQRHGVWLSLDPKPVHSPIFAALSHHAQPKGSLRIGRHR